MTLPLLAGAVDQGERVLRRVEHDGLAVEQRVPVAAEDGRASQWVFGDKDNGAYLPKFAWTKIVWDGDGDH
ncbi:hypothetical protein [Nonomuraea sp. KM90]|uniref:hypothetical protein n=1 Tax=Nonomuraea sp. KM90 TaxID=3457428 RepID=UPI003FCD8534